MPQRFEASAQAWRALHPGWAYRLWGDTEVEELVRGSYPQLGNLFRSYRSVVQRADVARYMILHRHGGVYSDLDVIPVRSVEPLLGHAAVVPQTDPWGVSNDLIMAGPGHPFLGEVLDRLPAASVWNSRLVPLHFRVLLSTASLHLTLTLRRSPHRSEVHVLPRARYSSQDPERAYVLHVAGNSWVGWDTHLFTFVWKQWRWLLLGVLVILLALALS